MVWILIETVFFFYLKHSLRHQATQGGFLNQFIFLSGWLVPLTVEIMLLGGGVFLRLHSRTTAVVLWCLNVSMWQHTGVTVINPFPLQACLLHNKATIPDAKASPHVYCYNYLTFKSTLMSPGWSHSLSSFGFRALLLSNKVTFHNTVSPWNTHPPHKYTSTCICSTPHPILKEEAGRENTLNKAVGGLRKSAAPGFFWGWHTQRVNATKVGHGEQLSTIEVLLNACFETPSRACYCKWARSYCKGSGGRSTVEGGGERRVH